MLDHYIEWAKTKDADVFISFHINSSVSGAAQGAEVYYPQGEENAQELAKDIVGELAKLGLKNRGDKGDDSYAVIRHSKRNGFPGLIIEHAFVSNVSDAKWFQTEENLKKLGAHIYLYEGNHEVSMEFLSNTIESYKGIAEDREKIDELMFSAEE